MKKKKKLKIKKNAQILLITLVVVIIICFYANKKYQEYKYHQTIEYKLLEKSYTMDEVNVFKNKLNDDELNEILNRDYNTYIPKFINEKYFLYKNLNRYLTYQYKNDELTLTNIVALINVNRDNEYYELTKESDPTQNELILVNKYNLLSEEFVPENLNNISSQLAYADNKATATVIDAFKSMYEKALDSNIQLIINSSYRSYKDQDSVWSTRKNLYGTRKADAYAARAGASEHQTGLAIDIDQYNYNGEDFKEAPAFTWLADNAYLYGFILRYPEGKEDITGYAYESWHYRYVGVDTAKIIHDENITFDEYYAYYIEK